MNEVDQKIQDIVKKVKEERLKQGLSHEKLAELAGVHRSTISLLESGKTSITLKNVIKISKALRINFQVGF
ncbi:MAG: transcriptional regulator [Rickettsiales bacterium]|nr:transcriptional regulator [Rickettsiales bacterium]|tara:strand:- start:151 stop:363 length:213 start_codon:yes stop_codon:yes gene_type:complete